MKTYYNKVNDMFKMAIIFSGFIWVSVLTCSAQQDTIDIIELPIKYKKVEVKPLFKGKDALEFRGLYINKNLMYPKEAFESRIQGKVVVSFVIDEKGKVTQVKVAQSAHPLLDREAVRVIKSSPKWSPGMHNGNPMPVLMEMAIDFRINRQYEN